jgi:DNA-binding NarL/FixJ family response regulator
LLTDAGIEVTGRNGTADELLVRVAEYPPDAVVVDIRLPPSHTGEGIRAALTIRQQHPGVGVLVVSQYVEVGLAMQLLADRLKESAIC